jgi:hypothetical protein
VSVGPSSPLLSMIKSDHTHSRAFGSAFDPILHGVAQGLDDLFPLPEDAVASDKAERERERETADLDEQDAS